MLGSDDVSPSDQRAFLHDLRASHRLVEWTPEVFDTLVAHCDTSSPQVVKTLIFLAKDILRLRSYEAATRLVCAEAAKDPAAHPLLRSQALLRLADGHVYNRDEPELPRSVAGCLTRVVGSRLRADSAPA
jgi:hypothetical protein